MNIVNTQQNNMSKISKDNNKIHNADSDYPPLSPLLSPPSSPSSILSQRLPSLSAVSVAASPVPSTIKTPSLRLPLLKFIELQ